MQETETRNLVFLLNNTSKEDLHGIISELGLYQTIKDLYIKLCNWYITKEALSNKSINLTEDEKEPITNLPCEIQDFTSISTGAYTGKTSDNVQLYNINKIGEWNISSDGYYPYCSNCGKEVDDIAENCPNCGAYMKNFIKLEGMKK